MPKSLSKNLERDLKRPWEATLPIKESTLIFSSAVFRENPRYCYSLESSSLSSSSSSAAAAASSSHKPRNFVISLILMKIFTGKSGVCVHSPKSNPYYQGRQSALFFSELCPLLRLRFFILFHAVLLFILGIDESVCNFHKESYWDWRMERNFKDMNWTEIVKRFNSLSTRESNFRKRFFPSKIAFLPINQSEKPSVT